MRPTWVPRPELCFQNWMESTVYGLYKPTAPGKNRLQVILTSNKFDKLAWDQPKDFCSQHLSKSRVHTDSSQQFELSNHPTLLFTHGVSGHNPGRLCSVLTLQQTQRFWALHYLKKRKKIQTGFWKQRSDCHPQMSTLSLVFMLKVNRTFPKENFPLPYPSFGASVCATHPIFRLGFLLTQNIS